MKGIHKNSSQEEIEGKSGREIPEAKQMNTGLLSIRFRLLSLILKIKKKYYYFFEAIINH